MSLYFIFTIDGDWDEYFLSELPVEKRQPNKEQTLYLLNEEIKLAKQVLDGKFLYFIHTSPVVRDFFLRPEFIAKWQEIESVGGDVGVHCHEEDLYRAWYSGDPQRMREVIGSQYEGLKQAGLNPLAYRGGFLSFSYKTIPILEEKGLLLDFSCEPGRYLTYNNVLVSDWRGAPDHFYSLSYDDHRRPGDSKVTEIPLGIYIERLSLWAIWQKARKLKKRPGLQIFSVLGHNYDFTSLRMRWKMKLALFILRKYGKFINVEEALKLIDNFQ